MSVSSKLKILKEIPTSTASNRMLRKAFETYFELKHAVVEGEIYNYSSKAEDLAVCCKISTRTFWSRLEIMRKNKLVSIKKGKIRLASWDQVCKQFNIKKSFYYINSTLHENTKIEYILEAKTIQEAQKRRAKAFYAKVAGNRFAETEFRNITGLVKPSREAIMEHVIECFKNPSHYDQNQQYFLLEYANPDDQLSCKAISLLLNYRSSASSGSYTKQKLKRNKLASSQTRRYQSNELPRKAIQGKVYYSRATRKTMLIMADKLDLV